MNNIWEECPRCHGTNIGTYRHLKAKVWCENCGFVLREEGSNQNTPNNPNFIANGSSITTRLILPLEMEWKPKEDITAYELSMCLPFLFSRAIMPYEIDESIPWFRHFKITDPNKEDNAK